MGYICGEDRSQQQLFPATLEELIDPNNPVRVIDAFVDHLNMADFRITHAKPASTGICAGFNVRHSQSSSSVLSVF